MASYFIDTEFLEGTQKQRILGIELPEYFDTKPTIDLISIGIVSEDNREYYAISKDFDLEEAWNRYDLERQNHPYPVKKYWIRENVLKPIWVEYVNRDGEEDNPVESFSYNSLKKIINKYGKTNKQIAEDIKEFVYNPTNVKPLGTEESIEFYGYYADYDWVVFAWLFGKMIDLPKQFPYYCRDLKQLEDDVVTQWYNTKIQKGEVVTWEHCQKVLKTWKLYPKQINEHHALNDAIWNYLLYRFLKRVNNKESYVE